MHNSHTTTGFKAAISFAHAFKLRWRGTIPEGRVIVSEKETVRQQRYE
jgi:hypothetical protein